WFRQVRNYAIYFPVVDFLGMAAIGLIVLYVGDRFLRFGDAVGASVGTLFAYVQWSERFYSPIRTIADRYNLLLEAMASSERIFELLDTKEDIQNTPTAIVPERFEGRVEFKDVWFAYEPGQWILKGLNLSIAPGERIAIVGHTGAGKTTVINLLSRFYDVQRGSICIDGVDVRQYEKTALRRHIGAVLQDVFLFSGSIEQNIRLGNVALSMERVRECAAYVNAARFIEKMPGKYAYDVGERGNNLSTGQRQLLAFARALAHEPQILVLDEATSSVDTETESLIQDAIRKLMFGRTSIVIAHRLSTVQNADRIVVMHHGEIREIGTHRQLLDKRGLYYRLYQLQYKDQFDAA
ncbi:MAG TPA: ABC transporter ATP-binding protein, partial [Candidatus Hydrogenedentes bacterium]|nr:ABC transporter ATP-binding protein [Candidatus Hydrogenedentota bacterium]